MDNLEEHPVVKKTATKPKVQKEWSEEDIYKLISLVENKRCLWDVAAGTYHNKTIRDCAWREITESFDAKYSSSECNAKWTNLRIQFRGYIGRAKTKSGQGVVESPKWRYYNAMSFVGRAEDQQTQSTISNILLETESDSNSFDNDILATPPPKKRAATGKETASTPTPAMQIAESMSAAVTALKERRENVLDPNTTFSKYLMSELKTLKAEAAAKVRKRVTVFFLECLEEERFKEICD